MSPKTLRANRKITSTEARILELLQPGFPGNPSRETRAARSAAMAQAKDGSSVHLNGPSASQKTVSQGMEGTDAEISQVNTVHFGCFNDRIQIEVQNLQAGMSTLDSAISELTKQFRKYRIIVSNVGDRYGDDEALTRKIEELETGKRAIWEQAKNDRDSHSKEMAESKEQHAKEMAELKEQHTKETIDLQKKAEAGNQKKAEYKQKTQELIEKHARAQEKRDQELQQKIHHLETEHLQKKEQLEHDNAEKIAKLEKDRDELEETKARLSKELYDRTSERDQEKELRIMRQEKMENQITGLQKELDSINKQYRLEQRPLQFYTGEYQKLFEWVHQVVYNYLSDLPDKALQKPVDTSEKLIVQNRIFDQIPIAKSDCSLMLRRAAVEHIIIKFICDTLWHPFFSGYLVFNKVNDLVLETMHSGLAEDGRDFQHWWKVATLKTLDKLDETNKMNGQEAIESLGFEHIVRPLKKLLDDSDAFFSELKPILSQAVELGKAAERDQMKIVLDDTIHVSEPNSDGWIDWLDESYEPDYGSDESPSSPTSTITASSLVVRTEPLLISPKILRQAETNGDTELVLPGRAIFAERGIFQEGALQWQRIRDASSEVARARSGIGRRQSASTTGLGMSAQSPMQKSFTWGVSSLIE